MIRRDANKKLTLVPYNKAYAADLQKAAGLLREAAALTDNASLKKFLTLRADAFLSNDYYASDVAWMDLDAPLDITIGPYETYNDELFGYKAGLRSLHHHPRRSRDQQAEDRRRAPAGGGEQPAARPALPQSEAGRVGAHPRGERSLRVGRWRARRAHRGLQSAQRRARDFREGQRAHHAEEHSGGQVRQPP